MNFYEALTILQKDHTSIQCTAWENHPSNRRLVVTGVDSANMIGVQFYDWLLNINCTSWSVFMPTWKETFELKWNTVNRLPNNYFSETSLDYQELLFNFNKLYEPSEENVFLKRLEEIYNFKSRLTKNEIDDLIETFRKKFKEFARK